jgi:2-methylisocitrate lyase-like PEP mutase family enzyme
MSEQADRAKRFLALHEAEKPLLLPNPWDQGSAKLLASLGFEALATTSSGSAASLGRLDGAMSAEEALASAAEIVEVTELPVSADLENGFADDPEGVAETLRLALAAGLAGASIEDYSGRGESPFYEIGHAAERAAQPRGHSPGCLLGGATGQRLGFPRGPFRA